MLLSMRKGFTLIELIIVIIIIGILAAISAPMMQNIKAKAIASEAIMGMGALRTALRQWSLENPRGTIEFDLNNGPDTIYPPGINPGDLTGTYFSESCYIAFIGYAPAEDTFNIRIRCYPVNNGNSAPKAQEARSIIDDGNTGAYLEMDKDGNITGTGLSKLGYK